MAAVQSKASRCQRGKVGALLLDKRGQVRSAGFNGHPVKTGCDHICFREGIPSGEQEEVRCCEHAEANCLLFARSEDAIGGTLYTITRPCTVCANIIMQSRVYQLVTPFHSNYRMEGLEHIRRLTETYDLQPGGPNSRLNIIEIDLDDPSGLG
jgi:deoxycytidylate deaminase